MLLLGGDKTGDDRFYAWFVPQAEQIWEAYLAELKAAEEEEAKKKALEESRAQGDGKKMKGGRK